MAAGVSVDLAVWQAGWEGLCARLAGRFARVEPRRQAQAFVRALVVPVSTRSCRQLAEAAGDGTPDRMQRLLARARWDHDGVRDDLRAWVVAQLGGGGIGIIDETGDAKKGTRTVAVAASIRARWGGSTRARTRCSWPTPSPAAGTPSSAGSCTCRAAGRPTPTAGATPGCPSR
jgi:hypothetical protein